MYLPCPRYVLISGNDLVSRTSHPMKPFSRRRVKKPTYFCVGEGAAARKVNESKFPQNFGKINNYYLST